MKHRFNNIRLAIFSLVLVSMAVAAAAVGDLTHNQADCTNSGLNHTLLGTGIISGGSFFPGGGLPVYECTAGSDISPAAETIIRDHSFITFEHILFAAPELWSMDEEFAGNSNKMAASSDKNTSLSFWGTTNLTQITEDQGTHFDTDIYQFTGGVDTAIGDVFLGSSLTYAHTEDEQGSATATSDTVGITPYVAYKLNDYIFASGLAGYLYTHTNRDQGGSDTDTHDYLTEVNLNAFKIINSFVLKGRTGVRYKHTISSSENGAATRDNSFDELTWVTDIEAGYLVSDRFRIYTGLLYEYYDREASGASVLTHDGVAFMRYGAEYTISNDLSIGGKIQNDLNDEDRDYISGSINARLAF